MIGIIGAMAVEIDEIKARIENRSIRTIGGCEFVSGRLSGREVVAAQCGIGKVNAAVCAEAMILAYEPELLINVGVGGSLCAGLKYGDIAIASRVVQHDVDTTALGDPIGLVSTVNTVYFECDERAVRRMESVVDGMENVRGMTGVVASGDQFVCAAARKDEIVRNFGAICCEMEGGAIAQVCRINGVRCAVLRSISDNADDDSGSDYGQFMALAAQRSTHVLCEALRDI